MSTQISKQKLVSVEEALPDNKIDVCPNCGNTYVLIQLKEGDDYNDFGDRYCPFCGLLTEAFCIAVNE